MKIMEQAFYSSPIRFLRNKKITELEDLLKKSCELCDRLQVARDDLNSEVSKLISEVSKLIKDKDWYTQEITQLQRGITFITGQRDSISEEYKKLYCTKFKDYVSGAINA
jgi:chromosome segregation ATPase